MKFAVVPRQTKKRFLISLPNTCLPKISENAISASPTPSVARDAIQLYPA